MKEHYWIVRYLDGIVCQQCGIIMSHKSAKLAVDEFHSDGMPVGIIELVAPIVDQHATFLPP